MNKRTPFYDLHIGLNAKLVDFAGWEMPIHYGSQIQEHHAVRQHCGLFEVSHMGVVDIKGKSASDALNHLLANNVSRLLSGQALYSCMLNEEGGVIDDLIVYKMAEDFFRLVVNAGTREKDIAWIKQQLANFSLSLTEMPFAILALQGPEAEKKMALLFKPSDLRCIQALKPFSFTTIDTTLIARTGYTGEQGYEIISPPEKAIEYWKNLISAEVQPCGLGARDTLRLEAGLNLYGTDMDETVTPLESNLAWTVAFTPEDRNFIGRAALEKQRANGVKRKLVGLVLESAGVMRNHQTVWAEGQVVGEITSGGFSPTLGKSIALARLNISNDVNCMVEIRNKKLPVRIIKPPFIRHGKKMF